MSLIKTVAMTFRLLKLLVGFPLVLSLTCSFCLLLPLILVIFSLAQSCSRVSAVPYSVPRERSRSHDSSPVTSPIDPRATPRDNPFRHRRVLLIVCLDQVRELATEQESDTMDVTTRAFEPNILPTEQMALFTYAKLLTMIQIREKTIEMVLYQIVDYIFNTWGVIVSPHSMDHRWDDQSGDVCVLSPSPNHRWSSC